MQINELFTHQTVWFEMLGFLWRFTLNLKRYICNHITSKTFIVNVVVPRWYEVNFDSHVILVTFKGTKKLKLIHVTLPLFFTADME